MHLFDKYHNLLVVLKIMLLSILKIIHIYPVRKLIDQLNIILEQSISS